MLLVTTIPTIFYFTRTFPYFLLLLIEYITFLYFLKKQNSIGNLILWDFLLNYIYINSNLLYSDFYRTNFMYELNLNLYSLVIFFKPIAIHMSVVSYLTFGMLKFRKTSIFLTLVLFTLSTQTKTTYDQISTLLSMFGILNYVFYILLSHKKNMFLSFKREVFMTLYFILCILSFLEHVVILTENFHYNVIYNYIIIGLFVLLFLSLSKEKLQLLVSNLWIQLTLAIAIVVLLLQDSETNYIYLRTAITLLGVFSITLLNKWSQKKFHLIGH